MINLVVWDWNGTLLADTQAVVLACSSMINSCGGKPPSREEYMRTFHFPTYDYYCSRGCRLKDVKGPKAQQQFLSTYEPLSERCRTRKGAREVLGWLKNQKPSIPSIILSNHFTHVIEKQLERLSLSTYVCDVLGNNPKAVNTLQRGNNKIHRLESYFERTGYDPRESLIIGDAPEDIEISNKFGMASAAITNGSFTTARLKAAGPDYIINSLLEVRDIINESNTG